MKNLSQIPAYVWRLLFAAALVAVMLMTEARAAECDCPVQVVAAKVVTPAVDSWIFARSRYSHDPETGARVAQYDRIAPVEPLADQRNVTSVYSRSRAVLRGADGSVNTYYRVTNSGNGRGGLDAEWERFHDAWRGSRVAGGAYQGYPPYGYGYGYGYGGGAYPGYAPGYGGGVPGYVPGGGAPGGGGSGYGRGYRHHVQPRRNGYGPGYGRPDAGLLDPDAADGYRDPRPRTPDRLFFNNDLDFQSGQQHDHSGGSGT